MAGGNVTLVTSVLSRTCGLKVLEVELGAGYLPASTSVLGWSQEAVTTLTNLNIVESDSRTSVSRGLSQRRRRPCWTGQDSVGLSLLTQLGEHSE